MRLRIVTIAAMDILVLQIETFDIKMKPQFHTLLIVFGVSFTLLVYGVASAGYDEGVAAYGNKDYATALQEFKLLASQGHASAQYSLGLMYTNGQGVPLDFKEEVKWYRLAAEQGHASAQYNLGRMYAKGQGVPQDDKEAVKWYQLAASQGDASAQSNLGMLYHNGQGVPQDFKEAMKWYRLAAERGVASAQSNLGAMYAKGQSVPQDFKEAVKWFRLAVEQGAASAQSNLGMMYENGRGVLASRVAAYALYNLSATKDSPKKTPATENRKALSELMQPEEINAAQDLTRELAKRGNVLKALDKYVKAPAVAEKVKPVASVDNPSEPVKFGDGLPAGEQR